MHHIVRTGTLILNIRIPLSELTTSLIQFFLNFSLLKLEKSTTMWY